MAHFIVRTAPTSKDGSQLGASIIMVTAVSSEAAKVIGAGQLGVSPSVVIVEPYPEGTARWAPE